MLQLFEQNYGGNCFCEKSEIKRSDWASHDSIPPLSLQALGDVLYLIRIPAMSLEEYADTAAQSGILTLQETTDIFLHYTAKQKPAIELSAVPRTGLKAQVSGGFMLNSLLIQALCTHYNLSMSTSRVRP